TKELLYGEVDIPGGQYGSLQVAASAFVATQEFSPEMLGRFFNNDQSINLGVCRNIVEQAAAIFKKQRQIILNTRRRNTLAHILVNRAGARVHVKAFVPLLFETADPGFIQWKFLGGQQLNLFHLLQG